MCGQAPGFINVVSVLIPQPWETELIKVTPNEDVELESHLEMFTLQALIFAGGPWGARGVQVAPGMRGKPG